MQNVYFYCDNCIPTQFDNDKYSYVQDYEQLLKICESNYRTDVDFEKKCNDCNTKIKNSNNIMKYPNYYSCINNRYIRKFGFFQINYLGNTLFFKDVNRCDYIDLDILLSEIRLGTILYGTILHVTKFSSVELNEQVDKLFTRINDMSYQVTKIKGKAYYYLIEAKPTLTKPAVRT